MSARRLQHPVAPAIFPSAREETMTQETITKDFWHSLRLFLYAAKRHLSYARRYLANAKLLAEHLGLSLNDFTLALTATQETYQ
jgi:hypothetical protein